VVIIFQVATPESVCKGDKPASANGNNFKNLPVEILRSQHSKTRPIFM